MGLINEHLFIYLGTFLLNDINILASILKLCIEIIHWHKKGTKPQSGPVWVVDILSLSHLLPLVVHSV